MANLLKNVKAGDVQVGDVLDGMGYAAGDEMVIIGHMVGGFLVERIAPAKSGYRIEGQWAAQANAVLTPTDHTTFSLWR